MKQKIVRRASALVLAIGFSLITCLPAANASTVIGQCSTFGVRTCTTSMESSSSNFL